MKNTRSQKKKQWSTTNLDALIFDLDGVVTRTAAVHMKAWQQVFAAYLEEYRSKTGRDIERYSGKQDYLQHIDGKPRYDGVKSLLESRNIQVPYGSPKDHPGKETICGLGNRKNQLFLELLQKEGVHVFEDTINKIRQWRQRGLRTAVISSSKNCKAILETANIEHLFDVRVDGVVSAKIGIPGKPAPDIFLQATKELQTEPSRCAIFEDAIAGVQAGNAGNFQYVVGVARHGSPTELYEQGANLVIHNFEELQEDIEGPSI